MALFYDLKNSVQSEFYGGNVITSTTVLCTRMYSSSMHLDYLVSHHGSDCVSGMHIDSDKCSNDVPDKLGELATYQLSQLV